MRAQAQAAGRGGAVRGVRSSASEPCTLARPPAAARSQDDDLGVVGVGCAHQRAPSVSWVGVVAPGRRSACPGWIRSGSAPTTVAVGGPDRAPGRVDVAVRAGVVAGDRPQRVAGAHDVGVGAAAHGRADGRGRAPARRRGGGRGARHARAVAARRGARPRCRRRPGRGRSCRPRPPRRRPAAPAAGSRPPPVRPRPPEQSDDGRGRDHPEPAEGRGERHRAGRDQQVGHALGAERVPGQRHTRPASSVPRPRRRR